MGTGLFSSFMQNTWAEATIVAVVAGTVGFFVVLRGATFVAHAIPQGAFTGAAGAALVGVNIMAGAGAFTVLGVAAVARLGRSARHDVTTALALVGMLGIGSLFLSLGTQYSQQTFSLLFGEPLAVSQEDLVPSLALGAACLTLVAVVYRQLILSSVSSDLAAARGIGLRAVEAAFLLAVGAATTLALPVVGALLVFSLMIGPPSAARWLARRPPTAVALSACLAVVTVWASVALAYLSNWPLGFFVGSSGAGWYLLGQAVGARTSGYWGNRPAGSSALATPEPTPGGRGLGAAR
jgi:zinc/manganese transport system permease protein